MRLLRMMSEGFTMLLSFHSASQATGVESFLPVGLSPTRRCVLIWTRLFANAKYITHVPR